jgi:hypothetical protein
MCGRRYRGRGDGMSTETITDARRDRLEDYEVTPMCLGDYEGRFAVIEDEGITRPWAHGYDTLAEAVRVAHELMEQGQPTRLIADRDTGQEWPARVTLTFPTIEGGVTA